MTKKFSVLFILAAILVLVLAPNMAQDDVIEIYYLTKHLDNPWFVNETQGAADLAEAYGDVELTIQDLQFDAGLALSAMDTAIGAGADGIIIVVPEQQIGPAVMQRAAEAGIPLLTVDDTIQDANGNFATHVGFDTADMGSTAATMAYEVYQNEGWAENAENVKIVSIEDQTLSVCMQRTDASNETWLSIAENFTEDDIIHLPYANTLVSAIDAMAPVVTANPDVTHWILWSCNDDGVLGGVRALEQGGVAAENIIGVGLNGHLACDEWNKGTPTGFRGTVYNRSATHGELALMTMYNRIKFDVPFPVRVVAPGVPVTPENASVMDYESCVE